MQKIWILEDDDNTRELISYALSSYSFSVNDFCEPSALWEALEKDYPSLFILDIMLPNEDGLSVLKKIRKNFNTKNIPVIMLTAKGTEYDRVKGLDLGADDYITKPFSVLELASRVKAVLRRYEKDDSGEALLSVGGLSIDADKRCVFARGELITLTFKEFELLHYLMLNKNIVLSRDRLMEKIWGFDYEGESRTVDMHIKSLRQKLGDSSSVIKTVRNIGYKLEE